MSAYGHKGLQSRLGVELFSNVDACCILHFTKESGFYRGIKITF